MKKEIVQIAHLIKNDPIMKDQVDIAYNPKYKIPENHKDAFEKARRRIREEIQWWIDLLEKNPQMWKIIENN